MICEGSMECRIKSCLSIGWEMAQVWREEARNLGCPLVVMRTPLTADMEASHNRWEISFLAAGLLPFLSCSYAVVTQSGL